MATVQRADPLRIGSLTVVPVSDGTLWMDPSSIFRDAQPEQWQPRVPLDAQGRAELALTCLLVRVGERRILVDTGFGPRPDRPDATSQNSLLSPRPDAPEPHFHCPA